MRILNFVVAALALACIAGGAVADDGGFITSKPLTVTFSMTAQRKADIAAALKDVHKNTVHLGVQGVTPRGGVEGVRIFINKPGATVDTPITDAHYVTAFAFPPADTGPFNLFLDLTVELAALSDRGKLDYTEPIQITLVAFPAQGAKLPDGFAMPVAGVTFGVVLR